MPSCNQFPPSPPGRARIARSGAQRAFVACALLYAGCTDPTFAALSADGGHRDPEGADEKETYSEPSQGTSVNEPDASPAPTIDAAIDAAHPAGTGADSATSVSTSASSSDAGARHDATLDTGSDAALANSLPSWAEPLLGRYFKRSLTFAYDNAARPPLNTRNVEYSLLTIERGAGGLDVRLQLCDVSSTWVVPPPATYSRFLLPSALPALRGHLLLEAPDGFSSDTMVQQLGFDPTQSCPSAGGRAAKRPGQTWITGATCLCSMAPLPTEIDDCRVVDGDKDGKPGLGVLGEVPPLPPATGLMVFDYTLAFMDGKIAADRRHTLREERKQAAGCLTGAITDVCYIGNNTLCPGGSTKLVPAEPNATCAELDPSAFGELQQSPTTPDCRTPSR